jgi:hypothetical protein
MNRISAKGLLFASIQLEFTQFDGARGVQCGHDPDTGRGDVRFEVAYDRGAAEREVRERVVAVHRADRERGGSAARRADGGVERGAVAGRDHEQDPVLRGERLHRLLERVDLRGVVAAQAQVADVGTLLGGPLHARDDR